MSYSHFLAYLHGKTETHAIFPSTDTRMLFYLSIS